jgi:hypothetical protein
MIKLSTTPPDSTQPHHWRLAGSALRAWENAGRIWRVKYDLPKHFVNRSENYPGAYTSGEGIVNGHQENPVKLLKPLRVPCRILQVLFQAC